MALSFPAGLHLKSPPGWGIPQPTYLTCQSHPSLHIPLPCLIFPSKHHLTYSLSNFSVMFIALFMGTEDVSVLLSIYLTCLYQCWIHSKDLTSISGMIENLRTNIEGFFKIPLVTVVPETMICSSLQSMQTWTMTYLLRTTSNIIPYLMHFLMWSFFLGMDDRLLGSKYRSEDLITKMTGVQQPWDQWSHNLELIRLSQKSSAI